MKRLTGWAGAGALLVVVICSGVMLSRERPVSFSAPAENGYTLFLQAAASLPNQAAPELTNHPAVAIFVSRSTEAYALVHAGLKRDCRVPVQVSRQWYAQHLRRELPGLKTLTQAQIARASQAGLKGRAAEAFEAYKEAYCFADAIGRGGLAADLLYSMSCKALVLDECKSIIASLTPAQKSELLNLIQRLEAEQDRPEAVANRSHQWQRATLGVKGRLDEWREAINEAWDRRSWAPLASGRSVLADRTASYQKKHVKPICERLADAAAPGQRRAEPGSAGNWSLPFRAGTNPASPTADSNR